ALTVILSLLFISLSTTSTYAQTIERQVMSSAGETMSRGDFKLDFTIGETVAQTFTNGNQLSQGFQQVWLMTTAVSDPKSDWNISLYPNPTVGLLNIESEDPLKARIVDVLGKAVLEAHTESGHGHLDLTSLPTGTYFLMLNHESKADVKSYRIVKIE
ncbi:MAG: T9SS type A sorting domain-containing protein, partial [Saprospiraceae bacterium]